MPHEDTLTLPGIRPLPDGLHPAKHEQILAGARRVFMRDGFDAASMETVAREAGVSKGTLYNHFDSKEALFGELIETRCRLIRQQVFALDDAVGPPEVVLHQIGINFVRCVLEPEAMQMFRTLVAQVHRFPTLGQVFEASGPGPALATLSAYLERQCQAGALEIEDAGLAARQFIGMCEAGATKRAHLAMGVPDAEEIERAVSSAVQVFMAGYRPRTRLTTGPRAGPQSLA